MKEINLFKRKEIPIEIVNHKYSVNSLIVLFFIYSVVGWIWEVLFEYLAYGEFVNRGFLSGPYLPIYGFGGTLVLILFQKTREKPVKTFFLTGIFCIIIEFITGVIIERLTGERLWDYSSSKLNVGGQICFEGFIFFGLGCCLSIYFMSFKLDKFIRKIPIKTLKTLSIFIILLLTADFFF